MLSIIKFSLIIFLIQLSFFSFSQTPATPVKDTVKEFEIIRGPSMRSIYIDSATTLQTIAGGGVVKQGTTTFYADSMVINPTLHTAEAFNNVHINQADSVQTYAQYLIYYGKEKNAILKKDVRLYDSSATLFTENLDYNLGTGIGNYHDGGKVINGKTTITSLDGTYYSDTKDIYFKNNVEVVQPKNHVKTDSLLYNMQTQNYFLNGKTAIKTPEAVIYTNEGNYDNKSDYTLFTSRTKVIDTSGRVYIANTMAMDNKTGNAQMEGNALIRDSAGGYTALANQIFLNKKNNSFLATRKPVLIIKQDKDSIYMAGDTIFSGFSTGVEKVQFLIQRDSIINDSLQKKITKDSLSVNDSTHSRDTSISSKRQALVNDSLNSKQIKVNILKTDTSSLFYKKLFPPKKDSGVISLPKPDTSRLINSLPAKKVDSLVINNLKPLPLTLKDTSHLKHGDSLLKKTDSSFVRRQEKEDYDFAKDSLPNLKKDSLIQKSDTSLLTVKDKRKSDSSKVLSDSTSKPDSIRYFIAFHHVKIYNDSLQSICDSLFFSSKDSVFRLFYHPVLWSGHSQITGDTMFLYTQNKKAKRLYVFDSGFIVNRTPEGFFNQMAGKTINGYFLDGKIDSARVKGSQAESIYYAIDSDSAYLGMNRATGDVIDLFFDSSDLKKVVFINQVQGKFYPMKKIPDDQRFMKNFIWLDNKRPKNKLELFE